MTAFWLAAAALLGVALAAVLVPLLRRPRGPGTTSREANVAVYRERLARLEEDLAAGSVEAGAGAEARADLERELLEALEGGDDAETHEHARSPLVAVLVAALVPVTAIGLYLHLGSPGALLGPPPAAPAPDTGAQHSIEEMVGRIEARLAAAPDDPDGWLMLGRTYAALGRLDEARDALARAERLRPEDPLTLLATAEVLAGLQGNTLDGEPARLIRRAVELAPDSPRALWLAGVEAMSRGDAAAAAALWRRLDALGVLEPEAASRVREAIAAASGAPAAGTSREAPAPAAGGAAITVRVTLDPALRARAAPGDALFVFARAAEGPRMPLAVARRTVSDLPLEVTLDDTMAMTPQMRLSAFDRVVVGARVSRTGSANPGSGDLEGASAPLTPGAGATAEVVIDRARP